MTSFMRYVEPRCVASWNRLGNVSHSHIVQTWSANFGSFPAQHSRVHVMYSYSIRQCAATAYSTKIDVSM